MKHNRKELISEIKRMFERDSERRIFKKFIEYIRFPFFKNFEKDLRVDFTFPITFIVGQNGSGKSSLLHALYGAPTGYSIEDYWFSTELDPIEDKIGSDKKIERHCFVYAYKTPVTLTLAEILKTRINRKNNSDYWEPSRPVKKYGMNLPEKHDKSEVTRKGDRWKVLDKKVYYTDFRYSLSAYDKYFYFGSQPANKKKLKSKQDVIRKYAKKLKYAFDNDTEVVLRSRIIKKPVTLSEDELDEIKYVLGKNYSEAKLTEHNIYDRNTGFAIRYKTKGLVYSEAYAGSGETAVVKLIHDLYYADEYSLVLLDEPETSLHPLAQKNLIDFILRQIIKKKLQVVVSTHSPDIIDGMPPESVKILYENIGTGKTGIIENVYPENAFVHIGRTVTDKKIILTEDKLSKMIIDAVLKEIGDTELFEVVYYPGGASQMKQQEMTVYSKESNSKHFIVFDGDQRKSIKYNNSRHYYEPGDNLSRVDKININFLSYEARKPHNLEKTIESLTGQRIKFLFDSNQTEEQKSRLMLKYIKYHHNNVFYLPKSTPEEIIWNDDLVEGSDFSEQEKEKIIKETDYKKKFALYAKAEYDDNNADDIERIHKKFIKRWIKKENNNDFRAICDIIRMIKGRSDE